MPRARWNFHRGDCAGIQVALVNAERERERERQGGRGRDRKGRKGGKERGRFSERKAIALGAIQNPLDVIYITATPRDSLLIIHNPIQLMKLPIGFIYVLP